MHAGLPLRSAGGTSKQAAGGGALSSSCAHAERTRCLTPSAHGRVPTRSMPCAKMRFTSLASLLAPALPPLHAVASFSRRCIRSATAGSDMLSIAAAGACGGCASTACAAAMLAQRLLAQVLLQGSSYDCLVRGALLSSSEARSHRLPLPL